jgi:hypothetical protein
VTSIAEKHDKEVKISECLSNSCSSINDITSLLKKWVRDLPDPMVPFNLTMNADSVHENNKIIEFADNLPGAHKLTLKYLVGYLRFVSQSEEINLISAYNLAVRNR